MYVCVCACVIIPSGIAGSYGNSEFTFFGSAAILLLMVAMPCHIPPLLSGPKTKVNS